MVVMWKEPGEQGPTRLGLPYLRRLTTMIRRIIVTT